MIVSGTILYLAMTGMRVYVNPSSMLRDMLGRVVLQPDPAMLERYAPRYRFMLENMAFFEGRSIPPETLVEVATTWCTLRNCEMVVGPDVLGDHRATMRLHTVYADLAPTWLLEKTLGVVQERRLSRIERALKEIRDLGYEMLGIPSDNTAAMHHIATARKHYRYIHVLGCQQGCLARILRTRPDSVDVYVDPGVAHGAPPA